MAKYLANDTIALAREMLSIGISAVSIYHRHFSTDNPTHREDY